VIREAAGEHPRSTGGRSSATTPGPYGFRAEIWNARSQAGAAGWRKVVICYGTVIGREVSAITAIIAESLEDYNARVKKIRATELA
jgi:hypothetical protein